jgi:hypothetical protein
MLTVLVSALALFAADHHEATDSGCGYSTNGTIEEQFDRCMAGGWSRIDDCSETGQIDHRGFTDSTGEFCPIDYLIRDPHTGGFRVGFQCPGDDRRIRVLIVEDGVISSSDGVSDFTPVAQQCTPETTDQ